MLMLNFNEKSMNTYVMALMYRDRIPWTHIWIFKTNEIIIYLHTVLFLCNIQVVSENESNFKHMNFKYMYTYEPHTHIFK